MVNRRDELALYLYYALFGFNDLPPKWQALHDPMLSL
jgi:hypothetical protein